MKQIKLTQEAVCDRYKTSCVVSYPFQKIGISDNFGTGLVPLNGLRHNPVGDTCGWYLWAGEEIGLADDYFKPLHVAHLSEMVPGILKFLGLPPGWRFLIAEDYEDIWYDPSLLGA